MGMGPGHGGGLEVTGPDNPGAMAHRVKPLQGEASLPLLWLWEEEVWCAVLREETMASGGGHTLPVRWKGSV